jgi:galactose mutarotase-like enzyme
MRFALAGLTLNILAAIKNLEDDKTLPASFGFHPALRWPLPYGQPRAAHAVQFERDEPMPVRRVDSKGLVLPSAFATPVRERRLQLRDDLFTDDAIIFDPIASRSLRYGADTGPQLEFRFPDTPYLGIWSKPGAPFICIEPWHGHADPEGFSGDFRAKPGIFLVPPGGIKECAMSISLRA